MRNTLQFCALGVILLGGMSGRLMAQAVSGTILGTVQDSTGAAIAGAPVTILSPETGVTRTAVTNSSGEYDVPSLPPGTYNASAEEKGFKKVSISGIRLNVDQKVRVDLKLEVGEITESIQVQGSAPLVQSDSSELGHTVNEAQVKELPLNGRNFVQLTRLVPGVTRGVPGSNNDGASNEGWRMSSTIVANGMRARDNNFLLDGIDNNELNLNTVIIFLERADRDRSIQSAPTSTYFPAGVRPGQRRRREHSDQNQEPTSSTAADSSSCGMTNSTRMICLITSSAARSRPSGRINSAQP